jgi:hypothetical protein
MILLFLSGGGFEDYKREISPSIRRVGTFKRLSKNLFRPAEGKIAMLAHPSNKQVLLAKRFNAEMASSFDS